MYEAVNAIKQELLVARIDTRLSADTVLGLELFENATAHRIHVISGRGELLASLLASEPGETAADERPAWKSVSVQFMLPRARRCALHRLACLVLALFLDRTMEEPGTTRGGGKSWQISTLNLGSRVYAHGDSAGFTLSAYHAVSTPAG